MLERMKSTIDSIASKLRWRDTDIASLYSLPYLVSSNARDLADLL